MASSIHSLPSVISQRQIKGPSRRLLEQKVDSLVQENIRKDRFGSMELLNGSTALFRMARCSKILVVQQTELIEAWDVSEGKKLWECPLTDTANFKVESLQTDDKGGVALYLKSQNRLGCSRIDLFSDGKQTGRVAFPFDMGIGEVAICGNLFTIQGAPSAVDYKKSLSLCEWDLEGNLVNQIPLSCLAEHPWGRVCVNSDYFVLCTGTDRPDSSGKILRFDRKTGRCSCFDLEISKEKTVIDALGFLESRLLIGEHDSLKDPECSVLVNRDPRIGIFNLHSGKRERTIAVPSAAGVVNQVFAKGDWVVCFVYEGKQRYGGVYAMRLSDENLRKYLEVVPDASGFPQFELDGSLLTVCCPSGASYQVRLVVDLQNGQIVQKAKYKRYPGANMSFESGTLVVADRASQRKKIYIERFLPGYLEKCETSLRVIR